MVNEGCVFCKIVSGEIPALKVWEDDHAVAFLDIQPLRRGHTLVIPRTHVAGIEDMAPDAAANLGRAIREVTARVQAGVGVGASTVAVNNGADAGQEVPHVHVHVVPREKDDGAGPIHGLFTGRAPDVSKADLEALAERIRGPA